MRFLFSLVLMGTFFVRGELIDRIAIVVDKSIIKDSDIVSDVHATQFLNNEPLDMGSAARRQAARKLIDQVYLRQEIRIGGYAAPGDEEVGTEVTRIKNDRFRQDEAAFKRELARYSLDETKLRDRLRWQITVLRFIEARFSPAAVVEDSAIEGYLRKHEAELRRNTPKASLEDLRSQARTILTDEEVNRLLFAWLDERRKDSKIKYLEDGLA